jgi:hypothetical protein
MVGPLPAVLELGGFDGLVVGGVEIVDAGFQAGVHDGQVLVGQSHVDHQLRLLPFDQRHQFRHVVGIDLRGLHREMLDFRRDRVTLGLGARGQGDGGENLFGLGALVDDNPANPAGAYNQYLAHARLLPAAARPDRSEARLEGRNHLPL